ncbi:MAG TPA: potassium channel protein [Planctomycetaceae bacterium]|nr:potassium channel protein [Planctomycetaceae bacterium]
MIFEADTRAGQIFDVVLLVAIVLSITVIALETVEYFETRPVLMGYLTRIEWILTLLFTAEYIARLVCSHRPWRYAISFFGIVDLLACLPLYLTLLDVNSKSWMIVRSIRLLRVFRVLKMMRMLREADELQAAIWKSRDKIFVFLAVVMVAVTIAGTLMYHVEHVEARKSQLASQNMSVANPGEQTDDDSTPNIVDVTTASEPTDEVIDQFSSIPQAMYWAIVTMTTVGYGDIVPRTTIGKAISAALILLGYSLIIVPTGFVSAEIQSHAAKQQKLSARVCPACLHEGHHVNAKFCDQCGHPLTGNED